VLSLVRTDAEQLRRIVRGEQPLTDLSSLAMSVHLEDNRCTVENPRRIAVSVSIHDLAHGLLTYLHDARALREWAMFLHAADLDLAVEDHSSGELVLNALWDAAFMNPIADSVVNALEQLSQQDGSQK
jgi:hypothetical protein